jgi:hypothetical protein
VIHRLRGRVGTYARLRFSGNSVTTAFRFTQRHATDHGMGWGCHGSDDESAYLSVDLDREQHVNQNG